MKMVTKMAIMARTTPMMTGKLHVAAADELLEIVDGVTRGVVTDVGGKMSIVVFVVDGTSWDAALAKLMAGMLIVNLLLGLGRRDGRWLESLQVEL
jgi:hypothetical protein